MFQFRSLICAVAIAVLFFTGDSFGQDQTRFVLKLDNKLVGSLRSYGSLRSQVPEKYRNRISFIELQYDETNDEESIRLGIPLKVSGEAASITLDEDLIGQVKGQPVRIPVNETGSDFSQIILKYEAPVMPAKMLAGSEQDMFFIRMTDSKVMAGNMDGFDSLDLHCKFGDIKIPIEQVAGVRFRTDDKGAAVVILNNGDAITGEPTMPAVELKTDWGQADIEHKYIQSLTTSSNARFLQETGDFGVRWTLRTGTGVAPGVPPGQ